MRRDTTLVIIMLRFSTVHSWAPIFCVSTLENIIQISCWTVPGTLPSLKSLFPRLPLSPEFCHSDFDFCLRPVGAIRKIAGRMISKATCSSRVRDTEIFTHEKNKTCNKPFCLGGIQRSTHYLVCSKSMHKYDDVIKWKHFPRYCPFVKGINRWPVDSAHKGQWRGVLMFLWCAPEQTIEQATKTPAMWDSIALIMASL